MSDRTFVSFLLDETGSMEVIQDETIAGFNDYVKELKANGEGIDFSLVTFNSSRTRVLYRAEPVAAVGLLDREIYQPNAMTPLIDGAVKIINAAAEAVAARGDNPKVVIVMQTDGHENASVEYTSTDLAKLVKEKEAAGWQFLFLGAGLDAFGAARHAGLDIGFDRVMSYTGRSTRAAFRATAANVSRYSRTADRRSLDYSDEQRELSEDRFADKYRDADRESKSATPGQDEPEPAKEKSRSTVDDIRLT